MSKEVSYELKCAVRGLFRKEGEGELKEWYLRSAELLREHVKKNEPFYFKNNSDTYFASYERESDWIEILKNDVKVVIDKDNRFTKLCPQ